jgi:SpoVK/Ycf46/Vps4 family AAA+-type ATPase
VRADAAAVVSCYVGETARNIRELFSSCGTGSVLLIDEADALFARRTDVARSTDRYANHDTGVLLDELERFAGVVLLTSNLATNIDPAFRRRLRFVLEFPAPDAAAREALWRRHLPAAAPLAADVCLRTLAARYAVTGGGVRNAVLRAAVRAAGRPPEERRITMSDLVAAAEEEVGGEERRRVADPPRSVTASGFPARELHGGPES